MEPTIDIDYILGPIDDPDPSPKGSRRELRRERDLQFENDENYSRYRLFGPEQEGAGPPAEPDWGRPIQKFQEHLATRCKDLWVCAWLVECLLAKEGFHGLAQGFELLKRMCDEHWDKIEPDPSGEDGVEYTLAMVLGFSRGDHFVDQVRLAPITPRTGAYEAASCGTIDSIDTAVKSQLTAEAKEVFTQELHASLRTAQTFWGMLETRLQEVTGDSKLPFRKVSDTLSECRKTIERIYPSLAMLAEAEKAEGDPQENVLTVTEPQSAQLAGNHLINREEAFRTLEGLSKYFRENEPNSPVSLALLQAVRWGRMSFEELMAELVDTEDERRNILRLAGLRKTADDED